MSSVEAWIAVAVAIGVFGLLALTRLAPYLVLLGGLAALLVSGVLDAGQALAGFANEGMITVGLLFVVASGLRESGLTALLVESFLGNPNSVRSAQARLAVPVSGVSAFLNNTPLVAILMPTVADWARRIRVPASRLLIPLSYASILGGMCTLLGTSTNLVVHGLLVDADQGGLGIFDISPIGVPCAAVGLGYLLFVGGRLLPDRHEPVDALDDPREYTIEMVVSPRGPIAGKTVEQAGLRHLPGMYLMEILRGDKLIPAVGPGERLEAGDQLVFVGLVDSVVELQQRPGLQPATRQLFKLRGARGERWFVEAVVSHRCPIVGNTIRDGQFRSRYNAVVIAVGRNGERVKEKVGDIVLQPGDMLLLEAQPTFVDHNRNSNDFYLVSRVGNERPPRHERAGLAAAILVAMVAVTVIGWLTMLQAALLAAAAMLVTRSCSEEAARRSIDWQLLLAIVGAFAIGRGLAVSGAAGWLAASLVGVAGDDPWLALACVCAVTTLLSEVVTNNAAAVIVFPIAMQTAADLGASSTPFVMALMISASASFATPLGYQTNLMVYGPGGYRMKDFLRVGLPLDALIFAVNVALTPIIFPF